MMQGDFSYDVFRERTKKLLEQYKDIIQPNVSRDELYDVTLIVNCLYGLLMVPTEKYKGLLPNEDAVQYLREKHISEDKIEVSSVLNCHKCDNTCVDRSRPITFQNLITGIRNGLAHWDGSNNHDNVLYEKDGNGHVTNLVIKGLILDYTVTVTVTFHLTNDSNPILDLIRLIPSS
jgi:hypothetical protein